MKKIKWSMALAMAMLCVCLATALAAGLAFSPRVTAAQQAEAALLEQYGVTGEMLTHFSREIVRTDAGYQLTYTGVEGLAHVLGTYTVTVAGDGANAAWSLDGMSTEGGLDAEAWGSAQLAEMLQIHRKTHSSSAYYAKAAEHLNTPVPMPAHAAAEAAERMQSAGNLPENELAALARQAAQALYGLTDAQAAMMIYEPEMSWYHSVDGAVCYDVSLQLVQQPSDNPMQFPEYMEKDGVYTITVNTETGEIVDAWYESALFGNG